MLTKDEYHKAHDALSWLEGSLGACLAADLIGVHNVHIYNWMNDRHISPTLTKALRKHGYLDPKPTRVRIAADVTRAQRDRLHAIAAEQGLTWSEYCRRLADEN